jgi:hypothetical protein
MTVDAVVGSMVSEGSTMSVEKFMSCKGQFLKVRYTSTSDKPRAEFKGTTLHKVVDAVVRAGIDFANKQSVKEGIKAGTRGGVQGLPYGEWESFPYVIAHKGERYYRLYPVAGSRSTVRYFANGVEVTREAYMAFLTPSARDKASQPRECFNVKAVNCEFPDADSDAGEVAYPVAV